MKKLKRKMPLFLCTLVLAGCSALGLAACGEEGGKGDSTDTEKDAIEYLNENFEVAKLGDFYEITGVKNMHISEAVIPDIVSAIGIDAFRGCIELKSITIPDSVTIIGYEAFIGCDNIETAKMPALAIPSIPQKSLKSVEITSGDSLAASAFSGCDSLTDIKIPDSVTSIGNSAFSGCKGLTGIAIPDSVTSIGNSAFA